MIHSVALIAGTFTFNHAWAATPCSDASGCKSSELAVAALGGDIVLHTYRPAPGGHGEGPCGERYADTGAPVAIFMEGGFTRGDLADQMSSANDMVRVTFLLPGGTDNGYGSDGSFDDRGALSIAAMAEVIAFAAGTVADTDGDYITDLFTDTPPGCDDPLVVDTSNVGVVGSSNGGNLPIIAASEHSVTTDGRLDWIVTWETPISSQVNLGDLGGQGGVCSSGSPAFNPYYTAWGPMVVSVDYSTLTWDDGSNDAMPLYHDGDGDGNFEDGDDLCEDPDTDGDPDGDGFPYEVGEDFPVRYHEAEDGYWYYSRPVSDHFTTNPIAFFNGPRPSYIPSRVQNRQFWDLREGVRHIATAASDNTDLEVIVLANETDHIQGSPHKDHIRQNAAAWKLTSSFFRINPTAAHLAEAWELVRGYPWAGDPLPDMGVRQLPSDWDDIESYAEPDYDHDSDAATPDEPFPAGIEYAAGAWELADREHDGL